MEDWAEIRRLRRAEGVPIREIARRLGVSRNTVRAALVSDRAPKYERPRRGSVADSYERQIRALLTEWPRMPAPVIAERIGWPYSVLFDTASNWINRLTLAHRSNRLEAELKKIRRYKLIIVDEVGYIPFDQDAADLFFQLVASRYEQGSIMVTSNLPFGRWGETFSDDVVAAAMIDRLVHHAEVLTLTGDSYRTRARRELLAKDRTSD